MSGVVQEVGMGVSHFVKGQSVVLMPLQSEYELRDCEHRERQRFIENSLMDSKGMPYRSFRPSAKSYTAFAQLYFLRHRHIFTHSRHRSLYEAPHISQHSQQPTMLYYVLPRSAPWITPWSSPQIVSHCFSFDYYICKMHYRLLLLSKILIEKTCNSVRRNPCPRPQRYWHLRIRALTDGWHGRWYSIPNFGSMRPRTHGLHCF